MTVLLFCIAFGLSMDYEVFLTSRIKELHAQGADLRLSVSEGLARTGRIVSTAAGLLAVSFFAFGTASVSFLQFFGLGCGLAILIDALADPRHPRPGRDAPARPQRLVGAGTAAAVPQAVRRQRGRWGRRRGAIPGVGRVITRGGLRLHASESACHGCDSESVARAFVRGRIVTGLCIRITPTSETPWHTCT